MQKEIEELIDLEYEVIKKKLEKLHEIAEKTKK